MLPSVDVQKENEVLNRENKEYIEDIEGGKN